MLVRLIKNKKYFYILGCLISVIFIIAAFISAALIRRGVNSPRFDFFALGFILLGTTFLLNFLFSSREEKLGKNCWQDMMGAYFVLLGIIGLLRLERFYKSFINLKLFDELLFFVFLGVAICKCLYSYNKLLPAYLLKRTREENEIIGYYNYALDLYNQGDYDKAIELYSKVINAQRKISDLYYQAYSNRGLAYHDKGLYDEAINDYNRALSLNSKVANIYYLRACSFKDKGFFDKALDDFNKAIELDGNFIDAILEKAILCEEIGNINEAIACYKKYIKKAPSIFEEEISFAKQHLNELLNKGEP